MRRFSLALSATSHRILRHLHPGIKRSIRKALDDLSKDPFCGKPLKEELRGLWSFPVSRHRIIYQIEMNVITVFPGGCHITRVLQSCFDCTFLAILITSFLGYP